MNSKGFLGSVYLIVFLVLVITAFAFIEPLKESLDINRGATITNSTMNCPGTPTFNQTAYNNQTDAEKLNYRPTCAATGFTLVWFIGSIIIVGGLWVYNNWKK